MLPSFRGCGSQQHGGVDQAADAMLGISEHQRRGQIPVSTPVAALKSAAMFGCRQGRADPIEQSPKGRPFETHATVTHARSGLFETDAIARQKCKKLAPLCGGPIGHGGFREQAASFQFRGNRRTPSPAKFETSKIAARAPKTPISLFRQSRRVSLSFGMYLRRQSPSIQATLGFHGAGSQVGLVRLQKTHAFGPRRQAMEVLIKVCQSANGGEVTDRPATEARAMRVDECGLPITDGVSRDQNIVGVPVAMRESPSVAGRQELGYDIN